MELAELIKRVEGLTGADREIDADAARCMGMDIREHHGLYRNKGEGGWVPVATYTASVDAVIQLIGEKLPGWRWSIHSGKLAMLCQDWDDDYAPVFWSEKPERRPRVSFENKVPKNPPATPAIALLLAFLRAWEARGEPKA